MLRRVASVVGSLLMMSVIALALEGQSADDTDLDTELARQYVRKTSTPIAEIERDCLKLLERYQEPEQQGRICAQIGWIYVQSGLKEPEKAIEYIRRAFEFPLDPVTRARLDIGLGDAIQVKHRGATGQGLAEARREAVVPYLDGLSRAIALGLPEKGPDLPAVNRYDVAPSDRDYTEFRRKHQEEMAARRKAEFESEMVLQRNAMEEQVVYLYSRFPFATEELRDLCQDRLGDYPEFVSSMIQKVEERIQERLKRHPLIDPEMLQVDTADLPPLAVEVLPQAESERGSEERLVAPAPPSSPPAVAKPALPAGTGGPGWRVVLMAAVTLGVVAGVLLMVVIVRRARR